MKYPLTFSFKIVALAPQITVRDAGGSTVCYVKQKLFKLKEAVHVFADTDKQEELATIKADRIIDFNAAYTFADNSGTPFGSVRRKGMRSIFKARYEILDTGGGLAAEVNEENGWIKVLDGLFESIPIICMFSGYVFHPTYLVTRGDGTPVLRVKKEKAFFESKYVVESLVETGGEEQLRYLMSLLMMVLLERSRG